MFSSTNPPKPYASKAKPNIVHGYREICSHKVLMSQLSAYERKSERKDARPFISFSGFVDKTMWPPSGQIHLTAAEKVRKKR